MVSDVMTSTIIACRETDDVSTAIKAMEEHQIRRIPVVDAEGKIAGIISQADVGTRIREPKKIAEVVHEISQAA